MKTYGTKMRTDETSTVTFSLRSLVYTYIKYIIIISYHFIISWYIPYCLILAMLPRINIVHQNFTLNGLEQGDSGRAVLRWSSVNLGNVLSLWAKFMGKIFLPFVCCFEVLLYQLKLFLWVTRSRSLAGSSHGVSMDTTCQVGLKIYNQLEPSNCGVNQF